MKILFMGGNLREKADREAAKLYEVDYIQIILNGAIAFLTSTIATIVAYVGEGVAPGTAAMIFAGTFFPTFMAKVVTEYAKKRAVMKAARQAYKKGRYDAELLEMNEGNHILRIKECFWSRVYTAFNLFCYISSEPEFIIPADSLVGNKL